MLAQNFKTAEELGIEQKHLDALVKVLGLLERGELKHTNWEEARTGTGQLKFTGHFNMNAWAANAECGTIACIGGTAELIGGFCFEVDLLNTASGRAKTEKLYSLFYPSREGGDYFYEDITTEQAATALRNYLTTGQPKWSEIIEPR